MLDTQNISFEIFIKKALENTVISKHYRLVFLSNTIKLLAKKENLTDNDKIKVLDKIIFLLVEQNRFFDISQLYAILHSGKKENPEIETIFPLFVKSLKKYLDTIFIKSLTYYSKEIDFMIFDILGNDKNLFLELTTSFFKEKKMYKTKLSTNIYKNFIKIADINIKEFIKHTDVHFLAFYLSTIPKLYFIPKKHIQSWTKIIINSSTSTKYIEKITEAMQINPSIDFLIILLLSNKEKERGKILKITIAELKKLKEIPQKYINAFQYALRRILNNDFYDFNQIPKTQKNIFCWFFITFRNEESIEKIKSIILKPNLLNDPKKTETKQIFINMFGKLIKAKPELKKFLQETLRNQEVEQELKSHIIKTLKNNHKKEIMQQQ